MKQLQKEYNLFLGSATRAEALSLALAYQRQQPCPAVQYETLHFLRNSTADVVFFLKLELVFHAWSTSHNLDQTRLSLPTAAWNLCPENIFLEPTERLQSCPTQPIPGSSIHTSFAASSLLKQSYSYFTTVRTAIQYAEQLTIS